MKSTPNGILAVAIAAVPLVTISMPMPAVEVDQTYDMPQYIIGHPPLDDSLNSTEQAVALYHHLRTSFEITNKTMANWLGVKRRSLYNWLNTPESALKYGAQIEQRLYQLEALNKDMEPEHCSLITKIAFSPIYGDPRFGDAILSGASSKKLLEWYDNLYSRFEARRSMIRKTNVKTA